MQYKLYSTQTDTKNIVKTVLTNRGISDSNTYLHLTDDVVIPYTKLDNIDKAVTLFNKHFQKNNRIGILVDSDPDGYCSAAMMYMYVTQMDNDYPVEYILHTKAKAHGLSDDIDISDDIKLLIIPDAGTNDISECNALTGKGVEILILDHHEKEDDNPYALIVNNQISNGYSNKDLCGAGIVYKFLQALDDEYWNEFADDYLDLCALANISDVMDMRSFETRYLTDTGLKHIHNKCFKALIEAQDYSMKGKINIHNIQWSITPILNGMIRFGSNEEKALLFKAFIEQDEIFEYKKRATKTNPAETVQETIYDRAVRLCKNAKARQDKQREKCIPDIISAVERKQSNDKVVVLDITDIMPSALSGVVAIKISEYFNKPCILLSKSDEDGIYGGSARNIDHSPIDSFKDIVNQAITFDFAKGHANAFGVRLQVSNLDKAVSELNSLLQSVEYDATYYVDYILDIKNITIQLILSLAQFENIIAQGIDEPMIAIENIVLTRDDFQIIGKKEDTISFVIDGIKYIQFRCTEGNSLYDWLQSAWSGNDEVTFNIIGKPCVNEYEGVRTPQIIIEDVEVTSLNEDDEDW